MAAPAPDIAGLVQAIIQAANAAAAANQPPPPPPPAPVAPTPFALLPGMSNNNPLDYNKSADMKLFKSAIVGFEPKFDLKEGNLHVFLSKLKEHARIYNCKAFWKYQTRQLQQSTGI
jgi:hypothetical protein